MRTVLLFSVKKICFPIIITKKHCPILPTQFKRLSVFREITFLVTCFGFLLVFLLSEAESCLGSLSCDVADHLQDVSLYPSRSSSQCSVTQA